MKSQMLEPFLDVRLFVWAKWNAYSGCFVVLPFEWQCAAARLASKSEQSGEGIIF